MAILAPPDWQHSPRDPAMDKPSQSSSSPSPSQQQRPAQQQQQPAAFPQQYGQFQQQPPGTWTPSIAAAPFHPGVYYHQSQGTPPGYPAGNPYFDPANAQLAAQWAYQQMMFNAAAAQQQQQQQHQPEYFQAPQMHAAFNPFPSGTPPPRQNDSQSQFGGGGAAFHPYRRPSRQQSSQSEQSPSSPSDGWRPQPPYSRPEASGSSSSVNSQGRVRTNSNNSNKASNSRVSPVPSTRGSPTSSSSSTSPSSHSSSGPAPPRMPHHRAGSSSSSHSVHSTSSSSGVSSPASASSAKTPRPSPLSQGAITAPSRTSTSSSLGPGANTRAERRISRDDSSLALSSLSLLATRAEAAKAPTPLSSTATPPAPTAVKGSGLKGRLRRALSFNSSVALKEEVDALEEYDEEEDGGNASDDSSIKASVVNPKGPGTTAKTKTPAVIQNATRSASIPEPFPPSASTSSSAFSTNSAASSSTLPTGTQVPLPKKKSRAASLFSNARLNASTDNISLSSTVSSASVMIRKLGSMGRLARRNSLAGITGLFKDRKKKEKEGEEVEEVVEDEKAKKKREKKSGKGSASEASVSHATAELEAGDWSVPANEGALKGLSPAAKLARQHTLKSNAEAAAKAKEAAARVAAASSSQANAGPNGVNGAGVAAWERNTTTRRAGGAMQVAEDGTRVFVEDSGSDEDEPQSQYQQQQPRWSIDEEEEQEDEDEEWGMIPGEEDDTIRQEIAAAHGQQADDGYGDEEVEPWATDLRRSVERTRVPTKGILKNADTYNQAAYLPENMYNGGILPALRARSNSYNAPGQTELGPLARIPSPDPDHIDGLHRHGSHSSGGHGAPGAESNLAAKRSSVPSLPPLAFELGENMFESPQVTPTAATYAQAATASQPAQPSPQTPTPGTLYHHPALNSSAPALTTLNMASSTSPAVLRSATAPAKKHLAFASNLSVYDTFGASAYDRRSEPATWSRLTPQLAQRIKEELNSYKMEEMEVHAASRVHTQFFV
ncbi:hypothetical protein MKEN_00754700 [Mycena kentingensis (nom. inval.)]|nr:hypothetical protein MKEN_00754700 [Mycena kentingensis (nom. inval.)]